MKYIFIYFDCPYSTEDHPMTRFQKLILGPYKSLNDYIFMLLQLELSPLHWDCMNMKQ